MQIDSSVASASTLAADAMLQGRPASGASPVQAAREFEGMLTSMLLKQMRQTISGEGLFPGDSSDTYGGMFDMYLGDFIARNGGLGLAEQIESTLRAQMSAAEAATAYADAAVNAADGAPVVPDAQG
ncbi:Peptidoglycan hydrolase FlgJ [Maioricimonas rarisocia]|uniref:Peptidoglycan hydrolase FlgJ n=1 Tax=Maioricimonas rarisocia TaxID=2528026 RepID=A0A517ZCP7_9PLAN|nr:rod-binding protein [Maioricimonas rarisocia]QDU40237.1 Peptidoglycan hydrolase FlgJ [Maioricimonas rarisocia]